MEKQTTLRRFSHKKGVDVQENVRTDGDKTSYWDVGDVLALGNVIRSLTECLTYQGKLVKDRN
jgi:hypothetical protein